jgi:hypothetical protein
MHGEGNTFTGYTKSLNGLRSVKQFTVFRKRVRRSVFEREIALISS